MFKLVLIVKKYIAKVSQLHLLENFYFQMLNWGSFNFLKKLKKD